MNDIFETINLDELYFLQFNENDFTLSQIQDVIEKEEELIDGMHEISLGNKFDMNINIQPLICPKMQNIDVQMFGYFYSDGDRPYTSNNFEINSDKSTKPRFGGILDSES